jgi:hypothetical protein
MKTEREIIDALGEWLCRDMEKDLKKAADPRLPISTQTAQGMAVISEVAARIKYYKEHCLDS